MKIINHYGQIGRVLAMLTAGLSIAGFQNCGGVAFSQGHAAFQSSTPCNGDVVGSCTGSGNGTGAGAGNGSGSGSGSGSGNGGTGNGSGSGSGSGAGGGTGTSSGPITTLPGQTNPGNVVANADCLQFLQSPIPAGDPSTSSDQTLNGAAGTTNISIAKNLQVSAISGELTIGVVENLTLTGIAGDTYVGLVEDSLNASSVSGNFLARSSGSIDTISGVAGYLCLNTSGNIDKIDSVSGESTLIASSVTSISAVAGRLNIYGAQVGHINVVSGQVCLYDGATIGSVGVTAGTISTNCP